MPKGAWCCSPGRQPVFKDLRLMDDMPLQNKNILIIGGTGFIGSRLTEKLVLEHQAQVTIMSRDFRRASSVARYPVKLVRGDIGCLDDVLAAGEGKNIVIDCTYPSCGDSRERMRQGTVYAENLARAVLKKSIRRIVHVSSVSVYGKPQDSPLDESVVCKPSGYPYGDGKLAAEKYLLNAYRENGLPVVVIQPTIVYGPFAGWTMGPLLELKSGVVALPNNGEGLCNAVYVDDVVDSLLLGATRPGIEGERFLVSGHEAVTWRNYYDALIAIMGDGKLELMSNERMAAEFKRREKESKPHSQLLKEFRINAGLRQMILRLPVLSWIYRLTRSTLREDTIVGLRQRVLRTTDGRGGAGDGHDMPVKALLLPRKDHVPLLSARCDVRIDKARQVLGYRPRFDLEKGMRFTELWAKWANLC
jgi:nucleoside-diphosphate-sugar epimerase